MPLGRLLAWLATLGASRGVVVRTQPGGEALEGGLPCDPWQNRSTGELFCKPGFLVLGCQRCGTSSLYRAMTQHRQIKYTGRKDTFFWKTSRPGVDLARERCNTKDVDSYLGLFKDVPAPSRQGSTAGALTGEFSGTLFGCACCAAKLRDILPQAKMVVMLREPMGRAESRFRESVRRDNPVVKDSTWSAYREAQVPKLQACLERAGRDAFERTRFPLGPLFSRRTVRRQVGDGIWVFEQEQSLANIAVNVRMTAIRLEDGGLWVHNPVAPTGECEALVRELGLPVRYIVLGSAQYEHKVFVGPFSRRFPDAQVYTVPQQWSFPLDLPTAFYGIFAAGEIRDRDTEAPWAAEIDQRLLCPRDRLGFGYSASECAFFHRRSKTVICTDAVVFVPEEPPEVLDRAELRALGRLNGNVVVDLVAAADWRGSGGAVRGAQEAERAGPERSDDELVRTGWKRDALLALYFGPDGRSVIDPEEAFSAIAGRWIVGPVCYSLVYGGKIRQEVCDWAESWCEWDFEQVLPCHFAGPVRADHGSLRRAFEAVRNIDRAPEEEPQFVLPWPFPQPVRYPAKDLQLLTDIRRVLSGLNVI